MKKRTLRLGRMVAAITLPFVMGACTSLQLHGTRDVFTWQPHGLTGPRDVVTMTNERVPSYTKDAFEAKDPTDEGVGKALVDGAGLVISLYEFLEGLHLPIGLSDWGPWSNDCLAGICGVTP